VVSERDCTIVVGFDLGRYCGENTSDYKDYWWEIVAYFTPFDPGDKTTEVNFSWRRNPSYNPANSEANTIQVNANSTTGKYIVFNTDDSVVVHVPSQEARYWLAYFWVYDGRVFLDSLTIQQWTPPASLIHNNLAAYVDTSEYYPIQFSSNNEAPSITVGNWGIRSPRFEARKDSGIFRLLTDAIDSIYLHFPKETYPAISSIWMENDELQTAFNYPSAFTATVDTVNFYGEAHTNRTYRCVGDAMADWTNCMADYVARYDTSRILIFDDMYSPYHNENQYRRAVYPVGGGATGQDTLIDASRFLFCLWGISTESGMNQAVTFMDSTNSMGKTAWNGLRGRETNLTKIPRGIHFGRIVLLNRSVSSIFSGMVRWLKVKTIHSGRLSKPRLQGIGINRKSSCYIN
jgi:hypothetical protein